jgi:acyl-coenzyme A synthetase/AMP-(fatty) acid ligase
MRGLASLLDLFRQRGRRARVALVYGATRLTFAQLSARIRTEAERWTRRGLRAGDRALIVMHARPSAVVQALSAAAAGATICLERPNGNEQILLRARALGAAWVADGAQRQRVATAGKPPLPEGTEVVLCTSGTMSQPRAVAHCWERLILNASMHAVAVGMRPTDVVGVHASPGYSAVLVAQLLAALVVGASVTFVAHRGFPHRLPALLASRGVTMLALLPALLEPFAAGLLQLGLRQAPALRMVTVGGDVVTAKHEAILRALAQKGLEAWVTYGLTEAGPRVTARRVSPSRSAQVGALGKALHDVALAVLQSDGTVGRAGRGELLVATPTAMLSRGDPRDWLEGTRWLRTGDKVELSRSGPRFLRRLRAPYKVAGTLVDPNELKRLVGALPSIAAARVTGRWRRGMRPIIRVELRPGADASTTFERLRAELSGVERCLVVAARG